MLGCQSTYRRLWGHVYQAVGQSGPGITPERFAKLAAPPLGEAPETNWPDASVSVATMTDKVDVGLFRWGLQLRSRKHPDTAWRFQWNEIIGAELIPMFVSPRVAHAGRNREPGREGASLDNNCV
jgi:hypothetical protein